MNFEGQNINLQDALFVDNITGRKKYNKIQRSLIFVSGQERSGMRDVWIRIQRVAMKPFLYIFFYRASVLAKSLLNPHQNDQG
jgi:hypothetical protein